jgi:hypothetical protein
MRTLFDQRSPETAARRDGCLVYEASGLGLPGDEQDTDDVFILMLGEGWFIVDALRR